MRFHLVRFTMLLALVLAAPACSASDAVDTTLDPAPTAPAASATTAPDPPATTTTSVPIRSEIGETVTIEFGGGERRYDLFVSGGFPDVPSPLVVDLHGALGTPVMQDGLSGMRAKAAEEGFVVVQPAGLFRSWDIITGNGDDVAFIEAVVADVATRTPIDSDRVYATGLSNGGGMADRLACVAGDVFAAIAPVAGWYVPAVDCNSETPIPVMAFHGTADFVVPYDGTGLLFVPVVEWADAWAARNGCDPEPTDTRITEDVVNRSWTGCEADTQFYTIEGGGHGWPGSEVSILAVSSTDTIDATDLIWDFFIANPKG